MLRHSACPFLKIAAIGLRTAYTRRVKFPIAKAFTSTRKFSTISRNVQVRDLNIWKNFQKKVDRQDGSDILC